MNTKILDQKKLKQRRAIAAAVTFGLGVPLAACSPAAPSASEAAGWEVNELGASRDSQLVQGRDGCIRELMSQGKQRTEAERMCDEAGGNRQAFAGSANANTNNGGGSNALLWYMIGRNSGVTSYTGSPDTGYTRYGASRAAAGAPATLSPTQGEYLSTRGATQRAAVVSTGGRFSATAINRVSAARSASTSRGGMAPAPSGGRSAGGARGGSTG